MVTKKEIASIIVLDANKRYEYSLKRIVDNEALWVVGDQSGFRVYGDSLGSIVFPIWPYKEFALLCCEGEFSGCQPEELQLDEFINDYLPEFKAKNYQLSLLPLPTDKGAAVGADVLLMDLQKELDNY